MKDKKSVAAVVSYKPVHNGIMVVVRVGKDTYMTTGKDRAEAEKFASDYISSRR